MKGISFKILTNPAKSRKKIEEIKDIYKEAGWWKEYDSNQRLVKMITGSYSFFVAERKGKIIAMARVISDGINDAYIQDFAVLKRYRNCGIGSKMLKRILSYLLRKKLKWIGVISEEKAKNLYIRAGFKISSDKIPMIYEV